MSSQQNLNSNPYSQTSHGPPPSSSNTGSGNGSPGPGDGGGTAPQGNGGQDNGGTSTSSQGGSPFDTNFGVDAGNLVDIQAGTGTDGNPAETSIAASVTNLADINADALGDDGFANVNANAGNLIDADAGVIDDGNIFALNADADDLVSVNASVSDDVGGNLVPGDLDPGGLIPGDLIPATWFRAALFRACLTWVIRRAACSATMASSSPRTRTTRPTPQSGLSTTATCWKRTPAAIAIWWVRSLPPMPLPARTEACCMSRFRPMDWMLPVAMSEGSSRSSPAAMSPAWI